MLPVLAILALMLARVPDRAPVDRRVRRRRARGDWCGVLRLQPPASRQTHIGRFVGQLRDGTAGTILHRKFAASLRTFTAGDTRWFVVSLTLAAVIAVELIRRGRLRPLEGVEPSTLRAVTVAVVGLGLLGSLLNDSGLVIAALAWVLAAPPLRAFFWGGRAPPPGGRGGGAGAGWRRMRDSNSRGVAPNTLSKRAP